MRMSNYITRGIRNNNPLNIKISDNRWIGKINPSKDKVFEQFDLMEHGIRAGLIVLRTYIRKYDLTSVDAIINRFAPECENNLHNYTDYIKKHLRFYGFDSSDNIVFGSDKFKRVVQAMLMFESRLDFPISAIQHIIDKYSLYGPGK